MAPARVLPLLRKRFCAHMPASAASAQILLGRLDEAVENFNHCLAQSDDIFSYIGLAHVEREKGDFQAAIVYCEKALKIDNSHPRILGEVAAMQEAAGDLEAATATRKLISD